MAFLISIALLPFLVSAGPVFAPGSRLFVIKTEHFDIIYSAASKRSAFYLSSIAEDVYREVTAKLGATLPKRVPIVITPDVGSFNGYAATSPYAHIVLYDTSLDIGWTAFSDNLRSLFLHELTHAISLQIRAPWASFLSGIFGSWVAPNFFNTPAFMTEGVTVSFESADGLTGRANDPLIKERVRQDIIENRFKTPLEASGVYDEYPFGNIYYEYGGLFNSYLQRSYGLEAYDKLWKEMGNLHFTFSFDPYEECYYKAFDKTYGIPFPKVWADFRNSLAILDVLDPPEPLSASVSSSIQGLVAGGKNLFWVDGREGRAMRMDLQTMAETRLFEADSDSAICDASPDGKRLLVSRAILLPDYRDRVETLVYDVGGGCFVKGSEAPSLRDARFFRDGYIGIVPELHNTNVAFVSKGETETPPPRLRKHYVLESDRPRR